MEYIEGIRAFLNRSAHIPASLLLVTPLDDELVGGVLALAGLVTQSGLAPRSHRAGTADRCAALAAAMGVVIGVHDRTADGGTPTHVTLTAGLADDDVGVIGVADLTDGGAAGNEDAAVSYTHLVALTTCTFPKMCVCLACIPRAA